MKKLLTLGILLFAAAAAAQDVTNHALPIGRGPGVIGWGIGGPCVAGQALVWNNNTSDPTCQNATGALAVTSVFGRTGAVTAQTSDYTFSQIGSQFTLAQFPPITANSVIGNATAAFTTPTALPVPSCSGANQALNWTSNTGFGCITAGGSGSVTSVGSGNGLTGGPITTTGTLSVVVATNSNVWAGTANTIVDSHVAQTAIAPVTVTSATSTFTLDFSTLINAELTLTTSCPCTLANPTNAFAGLNGFITLTQDTTGSRTVSTWGSNWKFAGGVKPTLSTTGSFVDTLGFYCRTTTFCEVSTAGTGFQ